MNIQHLLYLVEISRCGSINKAAQNLYVTQPSISKAIMKLEENFGFSILDRTSKGIQLTQEGAELLVYAKQLIEHVETIECHFSDKNKGATLHFSVSSQHYIFTVAAFIEFLNKQGSKKFSLTIREVMTSEVIEDIYSHKSIIGIIFLSQSTERFMKRLLDMKEIEFNEIKSINPHAFLRRNHPLANKDSLSTEELREYPYIAYEQGEDSLNFSEESISVTKPRQVVYVQDRATMLNIIVHSHCYTIGTGCLLDGFTDPNIVTIPIDSHNETMKIGWIKLKKLSMNDEMREYVQLLHKYIDKCHSGKIKIKKGLQV